MELLLESPSCEVDCEESEEIRSGRSVRQADKKNRVKHYLKHWLWIADFVAIPFVFVSAIILRIARIPGIQLMPFSKRIFDHVGVFPIKNHYYEPFIDVKEISKARIRDRILPGLDWNDDEQLRILDRFDYNHELTQIPSGPTGKKEFYYENTSFGPGDAEYLYSMIRSLRPKRIVEIGSGNSTLMAIHAIRQNKREDSEYRCDHLCIEPFEQPWLEDYGLRVIRARIENIDPELIVSLETNDLLFIDSSHLIRPGGDVVTEYLELLPRLKSGVIVHVHDIFSPRDYPTDWILGKRLFLNEQYLVEAFLTCNREFRVVGALNYLKHRYGDRLRKKCPMMNDSDEPSSLYLVRS